MKKVLILMVLVYALAISTCSAEVSKEANWEYVLSKGNFTYSVDMNSATFSVGHTLIFWMSAQDNDKDRVTLAHVAIRIDPREFRFEEMYIYNLKNKELINSIKTPSEWKPIGKNSVIEIIVNYIFDHYKY